MFEHVFLLIPAFNEENTIATVLSELEKNFCNILVVDDGSFDSTPDIIKNHNVQVVRHHINLGQGAAISTGLQFIAKFTSAKAVVTLDADGQHCFDDVLTFAKEILRCEEDIIFGSRFLLHSSNVPVIKRVILKTVSLVTNKLSGVNLSDAHNGLKAIKVNCIEKLDISIDRFGFESQIIHSVGKNNISYKELPTNIKYTDYSRKKGQRILDGLLILEDLINSKRPK